MNPKKSKIRLDRLLQQKGMAASREQAKALIMAGAVLVADKVSDKAGALVHEDAEVRIKGNVNPYVSRGGLKLKGAIDEFGIDVRGLVVLDVGASTGGFTDCLLQEGAGKVYALDVGYGQLAWRIRNDERVVVIERTNIRYYDGRDLTEKIDLATIDASFISLKLILPAVAKFLAKDAALLALIKPQFEVGRTDVEKKGVVKNPVLHQKVVAEVRDFCTGMGLKVLGVCESSIRGPAGNREFFIYLKAGGGAV